MFSRILKLHSFLKDSSLILLGPHQTGKTSLLKKNFNEAFYIDLLEPEMFWDINKSPSLLKELVLAQKSKLIIVDEV